jgi:hypothetical protein
VTRNSSQQQVSNEFAYGAVETDYGGSACSLRIMGYEIDASGYKDHAMIGTSSNPMQIMGDYNGSWATKSMDPTGGTCGHYRSDFHTSYFGSWDDRN